MEQIPSDITEIQVAGCGDSFYAALGLELAFSIWTKKIMHAGSALKVGRYRIPELIESHRRVLVVGVSASGEVARTLETISLAKSVGAHTLGITHDPESSLARNVDAFLSLSTPKLPRGPGLLSYLGSLLMGYALCMALAPEENRNLISNAIEYLPSELERWISREQPRGFKFAEGIGSRENIVFIGAGPDHSSAMFSAAKVVEACGVSSWGQDLEEWAHIEYFSEPASMPTWLLSASGRSYSREIEIEVAAHGIGRQFVISRWEGWKGLERIMREAISPLVLWVGPVAYAAKLAEILGEQSFRGFGGGRSREEGGGLSRIRSSDRIKSLEDLIG
jgi:glucosamine--fructose-6-phosphate aminotransferase (isomerizing)